MEMKKNWKSLLFEPQMYNRNDARRAHVIMAIIMVLLAAIIFAVHAYGSGASSPM